MRLFLDKVHLMRSYVVLTFQSVKSYDDDRSGMWRIVGGATSDDLINSWPWMANINAECGGSIIASQAA